jgi:hypothetical protein
VAGRSWGELTHGPACGQTAALAAVTRIAAEAGVSSTVVADDSLTGRVGTPLRGQAGALELAVYPSPLAALCPDASSGGEESEANNAGLAVLALVEGVGVWALGDLEREGQAALLAALRESGVVAAGDAGGGALAGGVVVVAHHGSANQSAALAEALAPRWALFSAGTGNPYGHPTSTALDMYDAFGETCRTDQEGLIALTPADLTGAADP